MAQQYGYDQGNPFGDPNKFTRGTQESEVDRYNQWMRSQPFWQQIRGTGTGDFTEDQQNQLSQSLQGQGIKVPDSFHIDEGGNFNQKSRTGRNLKIAGIIGGAALGGFGLAGLGPLGGLHGVFGGVGTLGGGGSSLGATASGAFPTVGGSNLAGGIISGGGSIAGGGGSVAGGLGGVLKGFGTNLLKDKGAELLSGATGGAAQSMAHNRGTSAELMLDANSDLERQLIAREEEKRAAQNNAYQNTIRGSMAMNWQPTQAPRAGINVVRFGGPQGPANPQAQAAGSQLYNQSSARLNLPDLQNPTAMPNYRNMLEDPEFRKNLNAGGLEKGFGLASALSPLAGALINRQKK